MTSLPPLSRSGGGLLAAAAGRTRSGLEALLAERFPRPDLAAGVRVLPTASAPALVPEPVGTAEGVALPRPADPSAPEPALVPEPVGTPAGAPVPAPAPRAADRPRVALRSPARYGVQFTMGQATHALLRHVEDLLGRRLDSEDMERAFAAGLEAMAAELERRKFAATTISTRPAVCSGPGSCTRSVKGSGRRGRPWAPRRGHEAWIATA